MALNLHKTLTELGLSDTETRVYLAMLELGADSVQNIAKGAKISRTAAYEIIKALQNKGLASTFEKGKKTYFSAEDPDKLGDYFRNRVDRMKVQLDSLDRLLPELRVMKGGDAAKVRFYTGEEGVRALFRDVGTVKATEILEVANLDVVYNYLNESLLMDLRAVEGFRSLRLKTLYHGTVRHPNPNAELRELGKEFGNIDGNIWIYGERIAFVNLLGDIEVVIVENKVFAQVLTTVFNAAWAHAKPYKK